MHLSLKKKREETKKEMRMDRFGRLRELAAQNRWCLALKGVKKTLQKTSHKINSKTRAELGCLLIINLVKITRDKEESQTNKQMKEGRKEGVRGCERLGKCETTTPQSLTNWVFRCCKQKYNWHKIRDTKNNGFTDKTVCFSQFSVNPLSFTQQKGQRRKLGLLKKVHA